MSKWLYNLYYCLYFLFFILNLLFIIIFSLPFYILRSPLSWRPFSNFQLVAPSSTLCPPLHSQRVICPKCRLGVTRIQDLSQADMKKVRQLALIDMTALCDLLELEVKRHKTVKRKIPGMMVLGCIMCLLFNHRNLFIVLTEGSSPFFSAQTTKTTADYCS